MKCKFCNEELPERGTFCPICGMDQRKMLMEDAQMVDGEPEAIEMELTEEDLIAQALEFTPEDEQPPVEVPEQAIEEPSQLKKAKRVALFTGCIAALAVLALVLFMGIRGGWDVSSWFDWQIFRENTIHYRDSYTVKDKKAQNKSDTVVATLGDAKLTNGQLQIYYWNEVYDFLNNNYYYLSYYGMDYTKPLDEQTCSFDKTMTWQQYFLKSALQSWQANQSLYAEAEANNYQMPQEYQETLDGMAADLEKKAKEGGYANADEMVAESFGAGCTLDDYVSYMEVYYYGYTYFAELYDSIVPTMEQIEAYFAENEAAMKESGVTKEDGNTVDVRHILMLIDNFVIEDEDAATPESKSPSYPTEPSEPEETEPAEGEGSEGDSGEKEESKYSEAEWAACLAEAQRILDLWLVDPTEDYFAELANEYSDDHDEGETVTDGGIYQGITSETNFVEPFLNWCMDENRKVGDYEIVQTEYGYHIMYFSASEPIWVAETRNAIIAEEAQKIVNAACDKFTPDIDYKKIVLAYVSLV